LIAEGGEPPRDIPVEAQEALDRSIQETLRFANATSAVAYLAWLTMIPLLLWMLADVPIRRILNQRRGKMEAS
jgi:hypothetical protein